MKEYTEYVLGFLFSKDKERVALIRKTKPFWQKGFLNGIGGKCEDTDQSTYYSIVREFREETGVEIEEWISYALMEGSDWVVHVYKAFSDKIDELQTTTEEEVVVIDVKSLSKHKTIYNLNWLIPMALDNDKIYNSTFYKKFENKNENN